MRSPTAIRPADNAPVIHAVVEAGSVHPSVVLERVDLDRPVNSGGFPTEPISGAEVMLISGPDTTLLSEAPSNYPPCAGAPETPDDPAPRGREGCYGTVLHSPIAAGRSYELRVRLEEGDLIEGSALVPKVPEIVSTGPITSEMSGGFSTVLRVDIPVAFAAPVGTPGIDAEARAIAAFYAGQPIQWCDVAPTGWSHPVPLPKGNMLATELFVPPCVMIGQERQRVYPDSIHVELHLTAYNEAYVDYAPLLSEDVASVAQASKGVTGAYGVFAAVATSSRPITIRLERERP